ncbi:BTAD domain-containing putative transcriptional regulator [Modestobacter sp. VKM Ac-2986]|uniref:AfsR/SARP family transcriptional regulator n=1 Tax=Modestobacter sp. VKM Ac-2986 TaxID=3004140 RepID=UPI0022AB1FE6|nr:BTAD domain-containing putative transcriptional regulator [Modestobacter sp. VKM Ac-2986]MCZ2828879.1 BTAD domain-containing putative transcriptional regulator [Modestobacter sp. VKM Ac-2986]
MGESPQTAHVLTFLGPVRARLHGRDVALGSPQQRAVWSALVLGDRLITAAELIDALWGESPPRGAQATVRTYVSRLRAALAAADPAGEVAQLTTGDGGYQVRVPDDAVDVRLAELGVSRARELVHGGDRAAARSVLRDVTGLWAGSPLTGAVGPWVETHERVLTARRAELLEELWELEADLDPAGGVAAELTEGVRAEPLRERRHELLMLVQYRTGRRAAALATYRAARDLLADELGIEPGPALVALHQRVLRDDPALRPRTAGPARAVRPAQLPPPAGALVGRDELVAELVAALTAGSGSPRLALTGLGGTGSSAVAVEAARRVAATYPDGQLYVDLRAAGTGTAEVLAGLLRSLGTAAADVPADPAERLAAWRTASSTRRLLVVLDHVGDPAQLQELAPAGPASALVVTAARRLLTPCGLRWWTVGPLTPESSLRLLAELAGHDRVRAERAVSAALVAACSHQPLAVVVAAARLTDRPHWTVAQIAAQLDEDLREPVVMAADCAVVDAPLARSQAQLPAAVDDAFCLLAVPDSDHLDAAAAGALLDLPPARARAVLEALVDAHLLVAEAGGRYRFLGLLRAFARRQARPRHGTRAVQAALRRLADHLAEREQVPTIVSGRRQPADPALVAVLAQLEAGRRPEGARTSA